MKHAEIVLREGKSYASQISEITHQLLCDNRDNVKYKMWRLVPTPGTCPVSPGPELEG
jgi:hypothetical protein